MRIGFFFSLATLSLGLTAKASVWDAIPGKTWTAADEQAYSKFISQEVGPDFFKKLGKPYSDLKIDCADAVYALRIYYAKHNGLPFQIQSRNGSNTTNKFDSIKDETQRLVEYIKFIAEYNGTENLAADDAYPIAIQSIQSGDVFLYKIMTSPGAYTRHAYLIKNVNANGTFDVLYSTQARRDAGLPMNRIKEYTFPNTKWIPNHTGSDKNKWGFKRLRTAEQLGVPASSIPTSSLEQYSLALQYGDKFFDYVRDARRTVTETPSQLMNRMYDFLCHELYERVDIVNMALEIRDKTGNKCMDPATYDTYSTPSRDGGIKGSYAKLQAKMVELQQNGDWNGLDRDLKVNIEGLFNPNRDAATSQSIKNSCKFYQANNMNTDMALFYEALISGKASYHPNDSLFNRWGIKTATTAPRTTCPEY